MTKDIEPWPWHLWDLVSRLGCAINSFKLLSRWVWVYSVINWGSWSEQPPQVLETLAFSVIKHSFEFFYKLTLISWKNSSAPCWKNKVKYQLFLWLILLICPWKILWKPNKIVFYWSTIFNAYLFSPNSKISKFY